MTKLITAITLHQWWAQYLAWGEKVYETRHWYTSYRGEIAIHAGKTSQHLKRFINDCEDARLWGLRSDDPFRHAYDVYRSYVRYDDNPYSIFPLGAVIAIGTLTACVKMDEKFIAQQTPKERAFGDWSVGRYAWRFENVRLIEPVFVRGEQGLWKWEVAA